MDAPSIRIREGQWLRGGENLFAHRNRGECLVILDSEVAIHPLIDQTAEFPRIYTVREAAERASAASTRANERGSIDSCQRIAVFIRDLLPEV